VIKNTLLKMVGGIAVVISLHVSDFWLEPCFADGDDDVIVCTQGILNVAGPDDCGEYVVDADEGFSTQVVRVQCSIEGPDYWAELVGRHIAVCGEPILAESGCGADDSGGPYICVSEQSLPVESLSWSAIKSIYDIERVGPN
jgi:hypothetical protein